MRDLESGATYDDQRRRDDEAGLMCLDGGVDETAFARVFRANPCPMTIIDLDSGELIEANDAFLKTLELDYENVIGVRPDELGLITPERYNLLLNTLRQGRSVSNDVTEVEICPGERKTFLVSTMPVELNGRPCAITSSQSIADHDQTRHQHRQSELRFQSILEHSTDGIAIVRIDEATGTSRLFVCNDHFAEMAGRSREELQQVDNLCSLVVYPDNTFAHSEVHRDIHQGKPFRAEGSWLRPDGKENFFERTASGFEIDDQRFTLLVDRDITWRKQDERALRESRKQLQFQAMLLDQIADFVTATDMDGRIVYVNQAVTEFFGISREEILGRHVRFYQGQPPEGTTQDDIVEHTRRDGQWEGQVTYHAPDGRSRIMKLRTWVVLDLAGRPSGMCGTAVDITDQQRAVRELQASEERFRLLAEHSYDMICLHDTDGSYRYVSPACKTLLGYEPSDLIGRNPYDLFHPDDIDRIRTDSHDPSLQGNRIDRLNYRIRRKDGRYVWFETDTVPIRDELGMVVRLLTTSRDITERKDIENNLHRRVRELNILLRIDELYEQYLQNENDFFQAVANLLAKLWHDEFQTGCRIVFAGTTHCTGPFPEGVETISRDIVVDAQAMGEIILTCPKDYGGVDHASYRDEDQRLLEAVVDRLGGIAEHIRTEAALKQERHALHESNIAMRQVMRGIEEEKREVAQSMQTNVDKLALPMLRDLRSELPRSQQRKVDALLETLENVTDPFAGRFEKTFDDLTPTELRICDLIRKGLASKEIASMLHISANTVNRHRENIRKKLGLANTGENLTRFLLRCDRQGHFP